MASTKKLLAYLESNLILWYRPSFLFLTEPDEENDIQVLISSDLFENKSIQERVQMVMETIKFHCPELFQDRLIIIQPYTSKEMDDVLEYIFGGTISSDTASEES